MNLLESLSLFDGRYRAEVYYCYRLNNGQPELFFSVDGALRKPYYSGQVIASQICDKEGLPSADTLCTEIVTHRGHPFLLSPSCFIRGGYIGKHWQQLTSCPDDIFGLFSSLTDTKRYQHAEQLELEKLSDIKQLIVHGDNTRAFTKALVLANCLGDKVDCYGLAIHACLYRRVNILELILQSIKPSPKQCNSLLYALLNSFSDQSMAEGLDYDITKMLFDCGADKNYNNQTLGYSFWDIAKERGYSDKFLKFLSRFGTKPNFY